LRETQQSLRNYIQAHGISPQETIEKVLDHVKQVYHNILEETSFPDQWSFKTLPQQEKDALFEARSQIRDNAIPPFSTYLKVLKATGQESLDNRSVESVLALLEFKIKGYSSQIKALRSASAKV
jgi:hypothetical protein